MKKVLVLAVLAVFVMMPLASFAKTAITDSELGAVTAQEGVSIYLKDLVIKDVGVDINATGDKNGFGTTFTNAGWSGSSVSLLVGGTDSIIAFGTDALMIDTGSDGTETRTQITLPTITVGGTGGLTVVQINKYASDRDLSTAATTSGTTYMRGVKATISGSIQMYAH